MRCHVRTRVPNETLNLVISKSQETDGITWIAMLESLALINTAWRSNISFTFVSFFSEPLEESMYSTVDQARRPSDVAARQSKEQLCRASFDYNAQGDEELSFKEGDLIKILYQEDTTWWCGELHGKKGMFPKAFVDIIH